MKTRRLMYWYHIMSNCGENSLVKKFYEAQKRFPVQNDWVKGLEADKDELGIKIEDDELTKIYTTKEAFKNMVKKKANLKANEYLRTLKDGHSKMENIYFQKLECSTYLENKEISQKESKLLFQFRTRMYQVKDNFKTQFKNNLHCDLCKQELCTQKHLFSCKVLKKVIPELNDNKTVMYEHVFGTDVQMSQVSKLLIIITEERKLLLETLNSHI